jgi:hypothetical protein
MREYSDARILSYRILGRNQTRIRESSNQSPELGVSYLIPKAESKPWAEDKSAKHSGHLLSPCSTHLPSAAAAAATAGMSRKEKIMADWRYIRSAAVSWRCGVVWRF